MSLDGVVAQQENYRKSGFKIEPLFADSPEFARSLFLALRTQVKSTKAVDLDVPEINQAAVALAENMKMQVVFETVRMYTRQEPDLPIDRLFGVTSLEIG
ncbi:MAG: hypothetical protein JXA42_17340 [Anaerolineales bacterium]|nr:hypothetical protein [Anaerolineales bacterium]